MKTRQGSIPVMRARRGGAARLAVMIVPAILVIAALAIGLALCAGCAHEKKAAVWYHCPMHPTYISDKPGDCPICGMRLVAFQGDAADSTPAALDGADGESTGMAVSGHVPVTVSAEGVRMAGVRVVPATRGTLTRTVRAVGQVQSDERRIHQVTLKSAGYVERLFVGAAGQQVRKGDPILSIYSPDLLATQMEYLRARAAVLDLKASDMLDVRRAAEELFHASEERLQLLDVPDTLLRKILRTGVPERIVTLTAPVSGYVTAKSVVSGMRVDPGTELYTVTDLSEVWIEADFYEYEVALLKVGQPARLTLPYDPAVTLTGKIALIYPQVDPQSRTVRVRFEIDNAGSLLKPGMYANTELQIQSGEGIIVPDNAVLDTGERQLVFVETAPGTFTPRLVRVGLRGDGQTLLLDGVAEGDSVVVQANFLLDSESRIRAAFSGSGK